MLKKPSYLKVGAANLPPQHQSRTASGLIQHLNFNDNESPYEIESLSMQKNGGYY